MLVRRIKPLSGKSRVTSPSDIVVWDSHPLSLGATPKQVFIDGIAQFDRPHIMTKSIPTLKAPRTPDFNREAAEAIEYEGLPPLQQKKLTSQAILFTNLTNAWIRKGSKVHAVFENLASVKDRAKHGVVGVEGGKVICITAKKCEHFKSLAHRVIDLEGGAIQPGLVTYGSDLGLQEIAMEKSTVDGPVFDPLAQAIPKVLGEGTIIRAVDGLQYQSRDALWVHPQIIAARNSDHLLKGWLIALVLRLVLSPPQIQVESCLVSVSSSRQVRTTSLSLVL